MAVFEMRNARKAFGGLEVLKGIYIMRQGNKVVKVSNK